MSLVENIK